jgi:magnesium transporter
MLEIYFRTVRDTAFRKIDEPKPGSWIYVKEAGHDDLEKISALTGVEPADIRDSLDKYELPRAEYLGENTLFFIRHPSEGEIGLYTATLTILLTPSFVVAISPQRSELIEQLLSMQTTPSTTQKAKLILHIFLKITQEFTSSIKKVRSAILLHEQARQIVSSDDIILLTKQEEILNQHLTALVPMRGVLEGLSSGRFVSFYEEDLDLLEDLMIALRQSEDLCRVNIKSIRSLRDSYQILFTNDVNRTIKLLTALTILVTIPTITASIYGMNVSLPLQNLPYAFWLVMGITLAAFALALLVFRRKRWL